MKHKAHKVLLACSFLLLPLSFPAPADCAAGTGEMRAAPSGRTLSPGAGNPAPQEHPSPDSGQNLPADAPPAQRPTESAQRPPLRDGAQIMPVEKDLSADAQALFVYLLFNQAMLDENEEDLLNAARLLGEASLPPKTWMEGGVWLLGRKSAKAVPYLERARSIYPDEMSLALLYAEALLESGRPADGVTVMRDYLKKFPDSLDARLELALLLVKSGQFAEAESILKSIPVKQRTPLVEYYHARALAGMDRRAEAVPYLQKAIRGLPDFIEALTELAYIHEQNGNWKEARNVYERLSRLNFSPADVSLRLVNLSLRLKQPEKAVQYVRKGPDSPNFKIASAGMLIDSRHFLQAENILRQLAATDNPPPETYLLLADVTYEHRKNLGQALAWLDRLPQGGKMAMKGALLRAQLLADSGDEGQALKVLLAEKEKYPDIPEIREFEIRLLAREKNIEKAAQLAREAAGRWPENTEMLFLLGSVLDETGKKAEALAIMEKILAMQPDNYQALNYVGYTLAEENRDIERAISLLTRANEIAPNQAFIIDSLAWALFRAGRVQEALQLIRRSVSLADQPDPAILEHYGDIARAAGRKDEARRAYRRAIDLKPANIRLIREKAARP